MGSLVVVLGHSPVSASFLFRMWESQILGGRWEGKARKKLSYLKQFIEEHLIVQATAKC